MTELPDSPLSAPNRFPLSGTQEWFCAGIVGDQDGRFGRLFTSEMAVRISGRVDITALRGALDDVVRRHEILRTIVVRDARPRYQEVYPPAPAVLEVHDLPQVGRESRDVRAQEIIIGVARHGMDVRTLPLLRAELHRFDGQDSVLVVSSHHSAADGWSMEIIMRDLAAFYKARTTGSRVDLPDAPQYRELVAWEQARSAGHDAGVARKYWREKLSGGQIFALPSDHPFSGPHSHSYSAYYFTIDAEVTAEIAGLSTATRSSLFMVLLAAFNVLTHEISGTTDPVVNTFYAGRTDPRTHNLVGAIASPLPLRTTFDDCDTFRDVVARTRRTCLDAYSHEIPTVLIEQGAPNLMAPLADPMLCKIVFSMPQPRVGDSEIELGDGAYEVRGEIVQHEAESVDLANGSTWDMDLLPSGVLTGTVRFNLDDFDLDTVTGWVSAYSRILSGGVLDPDGEWRKF
jgi:condensation enzyme